ncbi:Beta-ureidopropionase, partial [Danaus plexippus plexippus]
AAVGTTTRCKFSTKKFSRTIYKSRVVCRNVCMCVCENLCVGCIREALHIFFGLKFRRNSVNCQMKRGSLIGRTFQALVNAADRDAISGWGAVVYIIEKDKITEKHVKTRMD